MNDRTRRIVRQYGHLLAADADDPLIDFGVGWGSMSTVERLTEGEA